MHVSFDDDAHRTARLLLDRELSSGRLAASDAMTPALIAAATRPSSLLRRHRLVAALSLKIGLADGIDANLGSAREVREAALSTEARGEPRFLVRVDEFPLAASTFTDNRSSATAFRRFHDTMLEAGCHYLLAVVPALAETYLDPDAVGTQTISDSDVQLLGELRAGGVVFAQHGTTHRTRHRSPSRHSELSGLSAQALADLLDTGRRRLEEIGVRTRILVPPFNRFDARHWELLSQQFRVIAGGPESVPIVGALSCPSWRREAVYVPCYPPLYGRASSILPAVRQIIEMQPGTWVPIVLHPNWEREDGFQSVRELGRLIGPRSESWEAFLAAIERSAEPRRETPTPV